jgi:hypothetical protein
MQILCATILSLAITSTFAAEPSLISDQELSLGSIAIGDSEATVLTNLGQPKHISETGDFLNIRLDYPGLTIWLGEGRLVGEILSTSKQYCTPTGICPGSSFEMAQAKYGTPLVANREDGTFMEYSSSQSACWLQIAVSAGVITTVRAECQP